MTFDNSKTIINLRLRLFIATLLMLVYVYVVYYGKQLRFPVLGIEESSATLLLVVAYLLLAFLPLMLKYKYLYFSDDGASIILRYYSVGIFSGSKNSVEIPKAEFKTYKIREHYGGLVRSLLLYRMMGNKTAGYPPVYISSLSKSELGKLRKALDKYVKGT